MFVLNAYFCRELRFVAIFTLQTQIFTQKYRSWLKFYSEFLRKKLAAEGSVLNYDVIIQKEDNFTDQHDASNGHLHHIISSEHTC